MAGQVKGILFADYVRMIRAHKAVDWSKELAEDDRAYLMRHVHLESWYPMEVFERFGNAILKHVANSDLEAVRMWGYFSVDALLHANPMLLAEGDPIETLTRFKTLRASYFDFPALEVPMLHDGHALVEIHYGMGMPAEEAASFQTMGFFERLIDRAGGLGATGKFLERSWAGQRRTLVELTWISGAGR
jgi:hypothetical protein